jgi:hypothetical protein
MDRKDTISAADKGALPCPCRQYSNTKAIYQALASQDLSDELIRWISGRFRKDDGSEKKLPCKRASHQCTNRVDTSLSILNDIRNACREYLEQSNVTQTDHPKRVTPTKAAAAPISYEASFPSLSSTSSDTAKPAATPNVLIARKKAKQKKKVGLNNAAATSAIPQPMKAMRRIRPMETTPATNGNIAGLQSDEPLLSSSSAFPSLASSQGDNSHQQTSNTSWAGQAQAPLHEQPGYIASVPPEEPLQRNVFQPPITGAPPSMISSSSSIKGEFTLLQRPAIPKEKPKIIQGAWATAIQPLPLTPPSMAAGSIASTPPEGPLPRNMFQPPITGESQSGFGQQCVEGEATSLQLKLKQKKKTETKDAWSKQALAKATLLPPSTATTSIASIPSVEPPNDLQLDIIAPPSPMPAVEENATSTPPTQGAEVQEPSPKNGGAWAMQTPTKFAEKQSIEVTPAVSVTTMLAEDLDFQLERLVDVYTTLIISNLVPSTPQELHLLVGLLTVKDDATRIVTPTPPSRIGRNDSSQKHCILESPEVCRRFAVQSLTKLKVFLGDLHLQVLAAFVSCPPVRELLPPNLIRYLTTRLGDRRENAVQTDSSFGTSIGSAQPILTLPFHETRDSRHNYKSRDESTLYKNREESRDAFLYQLRHFQNVRGRGVMDTTDLESALGKIRRSARNVISGVHVPNMHWFAEFFSDLLLQIGLVPMEETDKDLLKITDKDKLQKLHKRFSSKVGTSSKWSSSKMLSDTRDGRSPEKEAHRFFPGHQEFFFIFLQAADSYSFGVHLKSRLSASIHGLAQHFEVKGFQDRLAKLQVLAKFLGVLLFSPNWHKNSVSIVLNSVSTEEAAVWTSTAEIKLPLLNLIEEARNENRLISTVPWILELLRMGKWDTLSFRSPPVEAVFLELVSLRDSIDSQESSGPSLQLVSLCLESFFHQVVGLRHTNALRQLHKNKDSFIEGGPDSVELMVSNNFLFGSISHIDELLSLLTSISTARTKVNGTPRKMRPSIVSASLSSLSSLPSSESDVASALPTFNPSLVAAATTGKSRIIGKLVGMFFHQHGDLKEICEFVADRAIQKATIELQHTLLLASFENVTYPTSATSQESVNLFAIEQEAVAEALKTFKASLELTIGQAVSGLSSKALKVNTIATTLATNHAFTSASPKVHLLVRAALKKHHEDHLRKEKKDELKLLAASKI